MRYAVYSLVATALCVIPVSSVANDVAPLPRAHAHNDYEHDRPLLDALDNGFNSVEADIFLVDGELLVAHDRKDLSKDRTLENLYLQPLAERVRKNGGRVFKDGPVFRLLIDIKSSGSATWLKLNEVMAGYSDIFSRVEDDEFHESAITAVVSGNRPFATIEETSPRYTGIDGRLSDFGKDYPVHFMPLISDNWRNHFKWRGEGRISDAERDKLHQIVRRAHKENRIIRFWASPDTLEAWKILDKSGADLINTDDLPGLSAYLRDASE